MSHPRSTSGTTALFALGLLVVIALFIVPDCSADPSSIQSWLKRIVKKTVMLSSLIAKAQNAVNHRCDKSWTQHDDRCFKVFHNTGLNWIWQRRKCHDLGGHLVTISDKYTNDFVTWLLRKIDYGVLDNQLFMIGIEDLGNGKRFWDSHDIFTATPFFYNGSSYTNWAKWEPGDGYKECVAIKAKDGMWSSRYHEEVKHFICEKKATLLP